MATYQILRWDAVLIDDNVNPRPMIWLQGTPEFRTFCSKNNWNVYVKVQNSNSLYDQNVLLKCDVKPVSGVNTFANTGDYTIVLPVGWNGYPSDHGEVVISGLKGDFTWMEIETDPNEGVVTPLYWAPPLDSQVRRDQGREDHECFNSNGHHHRHEECPLNTNQLAMIGVVGVMLLVALSYNR